ncbi:MAG: hypothetical protein K2Y22_14055 [Candidatus Obscuribacterales bacterium]|nr:hypothetical protein [Candidatus Obscuribacterales bacterium]
MKSICVNINNYDNAEVTKAKLEQIKALPGVQNADWFKPEDRIGDKAYRNRFRNVAWVDVADNADLSKVVELIKTSAKVQSAVIIQPKESYNFERNEKSKEDLVSRLNRIIIQDLYSCKRMMDANYPTPHMWSARSYRKLDKTLTKQVGWFNVNLVIIETRLTRKDPEYTHRTANFSKVVKAQAEEIAGDLRKIVNSSFIGCSTYTIEEIMELPQEWDVGRMGRSDTEGVREFKIETRVILIPHRYDSII